jgi:hypothetical protein
MGIRLVLLLVAALSMTSHANERHNQDFEVKYPIVEDESYFASTVYFSELLELALSKSGHSYDLKPVKIPVFPAKRNIMFLQDGRFDINWMHTSSERESQVSPIRYPIFRGLGGWRLSFIRNNDSRFQQQNPRERWQQLIAGQGEKWPDTSIYRRNSFRVTTGLARSNLFNMLESERIDYFPRGIFEIWDELEHAQAKNLTIEEHTTLVYPTAFYLFVRKEDTHLRNIISDGIEQAYTDGSFLELFNKHYGPALKRAQLHSRKVIYLENTALPRETPLQDQRLWFSAQDF